jgi:hypothetical protein
MFYKPYYSFVQWPIFRKIDEVLFHLQVKIILARCVLKLNSLDICFLDSISYYNRNYPSITDITCGRTRPPLYAATFCTLFSLLCQYTYGLLLNAIFTGS